MTAAPHFKVHRPAPEPAAPPELQPWDELFAVLGQKDDAERGGDAETVGECDLALDHLRLRLGAIGGLLVLAALDHAGDVVRRRLARALGPDVQAAYATARLAVEQARRAAEETQVLRDEVRELRREVERLAACER